MAVFLFTNSILDIMLGATWWTMKKSYSGIYYIIYGEDKNKDTDDNNTMITKLIETTEKQQIEIKKLSDNIEVLNTYIEKSNQMKQIS
tara:strand:- start:311 stop:574 length:264 start_codon:yes stop_codon:yes gene_type:complete